MTRQSYTTKAGAKQYRPVCTPAEIQDHDAGFCLACGSEAYGVEPDARRYQCESCNAPKVYGLEELLLMGLAIVAGDDDENYD